MTETDLPSYLTPLPNFSRLSDRVWRVLGLNPGSFTLQGTNCYLIGKGDRLTLIDCTERDIPEYAPHLKESLKQISPTAYISDLIITHCHSDHWGGIEEVLAMDSNIRAHKLPSVSTAQDGNRFEQLFPRDIELMPIYDGQIFKIDDDTTLRAISSPGHSSDDCSFWLEEEQALFAGDCVLGYGTTSFIDVSVYLKSLENLKSLKPKLLYPGHGPVVEDAIGKIQEYIDLRTQKEQEVLQIILSDPSKPWTAYEVTVGMWQNKRPIEYILDIHLRGVALHLKKLAEDGKLAKLDAVDTTLEEKVLLHDYSNPQLLKMVWMYTGGSRL